METEITDLPAKCPAFVEKCPFDKPELKPLLEEAKQCPAFKDNCTFKNATTIEDVYKKLADIPDVKEGSTHQKAMAEILRVIHNVSKELKDEMGECPVFKSKTGCPFKTLCSDGKPLLEKLSEFHLEHLVHNAAIEVKEDLDRDVMKEKEKTDQKMDEEEMKLSGHLKTQLSKDHSQASKSHYIRELLKGRVEQKIYQQYVASLYFIYCALEEEAERHAEHPIFSQMHSPEDLAKKHLIEKDLEFYFGEDWKDRISVSEATQSYVDRIREVGEKDQLLLVAHHYIRYVGDLSGAQVVKKVVKKTYKLPENGDGIRYYEFKNISNFSKYKDEYRAKLDALNVDKNNADRLVEEARNAYNLNVQLFKELDRLAGFEEEIVHEEVDLVDNSLKKEEKVEKPRNVNADYQPEAYVQAMLDDKTKIDDNKKASKKETVTQEKSNTEWLRVLAAAMIALAVLVGFVMKMMEGKA